MNGRSLAIVCNELGITDLEGVLHQRVGRYCVEQWANFANSEFNRHQSGLLESEKQKLRQLLSESVNSPSWKRLAGGSING